MSSLLSYCDLSGEDVFKADCRRCEMLKRYDLTPDEHSKCPFYGELDMGQCETDDVDEGEVI